MFNLKKPTKNRLNQREPLYLAQVSTSKNIFLKKRKEFAQTLTAHVSTNSGEQSIKEFIDVDQASVQNFVRFQNNIKTS